jgi:invasion protein IalB
VDLFKRFNTCLPAGRSSKCSRGSLKAQQKIPNKKRQTPNIKQSNNQQNTIKVPLWGIEGAFNRLPPTQKSHSPFYQTNWKALSPML